jgi:hypothetical protein
MTSTSKGNSFFISDLEHHFTDKKDFFKQIDPDIVNISNNLTIYDIMCPICMCTFYEPIKLSCNHTFCRSCITTINNINKKCPFCKAFISSMNLDKTLNDFLSNTTYNCSICLNKHQMYVVCYQRKCVICDYCMLDVKESDKKRHLSKDCKKIKIIECEYCHLLGISSRYSNHKEYCDKKPKTCYTCQRTFIQEDFLLHNLACNHYARSECCCSICKKYLSVTASIDHINNGCPCAIMTCKNCGVEFIKKFKEKHECKLKDIKITKYTKCI